MDVGFWLFFFGVAGFLFFGMRWWRSRKERKSKEKKNEGIVFRSSGVYNVPRHSTTRYFEDLPVTSSRRRTDDTPSYYSQPYEPPQTDYSNIFDSYTPSSHSSHDSYTSSHDSCYSSSDSSSSCDSGYSGGGGDFGGGGSSSDW